MLLRACYVVYTQQKLTGLLLDDLYTMYIGFICYCFDAFRALVDSALILVQAVTPIPIEFEKVEPILKLQQATDTFYGTKGFYVTTFSTMLSPSCAIQYDFQKQFIIICIAVITFGKAFHQRILYHFYTQKQIKVYNNHLSVLLPCGVKIPIIQAYTRFHSGRYAGIDTKRTNLLITCEHTENCKASKYHIYANNLCFSSK